MTKSGTASAFQLRRILRVGILAIAILLIGSAAIWRLLLAHELNGRFKTIRSAGLPTDGKELNRWYGQVPDDENAALIAVRALALITNYPDSRANEVNHSRFWELPRKQQLDERETELMAGYVQLNEPALTELQKAFELPKSRYPIDCALGGYTPLPHLNLKRLAEVADCKASIASRTGDLSKSCRAIELMLDLARSLEGEPILISQLVRISILALSVDTLQRILNQKDLSEADIGKLTLAFAASEKTNLIANALIGERAMYVPYFRMSKAEATRITRAEDGDAPKPNSPPLPGNQAAWIRISGFLDRDLNFFLREMETNIAIAALGPPKSLATMARFENATSIGIKRYYFLSSMLMPSFAKAAQREAEALALIRLARTALAIEQFRAEYGSLPKSLGELPPSILILNDPFDEMPLRYRTITNGYVVYSIGKDRHDDLGREPPRRKKSTDTNSYDITFTVER